MNSEQPRLKEEDFKDYRKKKNYGYQPEDVRIFSPNPLANLLSAERNRRVRKRMIQLEGLLSERLDPREDAFLRLLLGKNWGKRLYLPSLEFVDNVSEYLDQNFPDIRERLNILISAMPYASKIKSMVSYFISLPYFVMTEQEVINMYQDVLNNGEIFPAGFFRYDNGRKCGVLTRYMYEDLKGIELQEVFSNATRKDFIEHDLGYMLAVKFNSSVHDAVRNAYPLSKYSELYSKKDKEPVKPTNFSGLSHLVDSLDDIFDQNK